MDKLQSILHRIEDRGYRITPPRLAVVAAVLRQTGHFTVDDILSHTPKVGRATVFRTVKLLTEMDILCRVLLGDGSLHYRVSHRDGHHHHLVCTSCGGVQALDECIVTDTVGELSRSTGYQIEGHWLELYGQCGACQGTGRMKAMP
jgi:Fur family ferric uptake transcriptional regulator